MTKYAGLQGPELVEMMHFFDPPLTDDDDDGGYRCLDFNDLVAGMERSVEFRALILALPAPEGRTGRVFRDAHDTARIIGARQAALDALNGEETVR